MMWSNLKFYKLIKFQIKFILIIWKDKLNKYFAVGLLQILYSVFVEDFNPISPLEPKIELIASKYTYSWLIDG